MVRAICWDPAEIQQPAAGSQLLSRGTAELGATTNKHPAPRAGQGSVVPLPSPSAPQSRAPPGVVTPGVQGTTLVTAVGTGCPQTCAA